MSKAIPGLITKVEWPGGILKLKLWGRPGDAAITYASTPPLGPPVWPVLPDRGGQFDPGWPGFWLDTQTMIVAHVGTIPPGGVLRDDIPTRRWLPPSMTGLPMVFQSVVQTPSGARLSTGSVAILN